ncbi:MAG: hypothetical protein IT208_00480 [Chthonomonadales bacterium]|nr:hypothetical protein [Chthonomonadales bacterium]
MKKQISPAVAIVVVVIVVAVAAALVWRGTQKSIAVPDKPPSGEIVLPPSQQGRPMPGGRLSAPTSGPTGSPVQRAPGIGRPDASLIPPSQQGR